MYIEIQDIITLCTLISVIVGLFTMIFAVYKWYLKQCLQDKEQDREIEKIKSEQCLLIYGVLACLKGLKEQGCNGPVTEAINRIERHLNKEAHDQTEVD